MFCSSPPWWHYCAGSLGAGAIATLYIYGQWLWAAGLIALLALLFSRILNHPCYTLYKIRIDNVSNNAADRAMRGGLVGFSVFPVVSVFLLWDFHPAITFLICTALAPFLISNITASSRKGKDLITQHGRNADPAAMENLPSLTHAEAKIIELLAAVGATDGSRSSTRQFSQGLRYPYGRPHPCSASAYRRPHPHRFHRFIPRRPRGMVCRAHPHRLCPRRARPNSQRDLVGYTADMPSKRTKNRHRVAGSFFPDAKASQGTTL
ncbi:Hypothetical protein CpPAT10_1590 [Corynebacterium pseudotuberculosis PAT10]|nr:Hypothetical protein CpPAT10_1590 [Corynebacterium pseudotuberculosis PAT10]